MPKIVETLKKKPIYIAVGVGLLFGVIILLRKKSSTPAASVPAGLGGGSSGGSDYVPMPLPIPVPGTPNPTPTPTPTPIPTPTPTPTGTGGFDWLAWWNAHRPPNPIPFPTPTPLPIGGGGGTGIPVPSPIGTGGIISELNNYFSGLGAGAMGPTGLTLQQGIDQLTAAGLPSSGPAALIQHSAIEAADPNNPSQVAAIAQFYGNDPALAQQGIINVHQAQSDANLYGSGGIVGNVKDPVTGYVTEGSIQAALASGAARRV